MSYIIDTCHYKHYCYNNNKSSLAHIITSNMTDRSVFICYAEYGT